jgi:hypothetical protein
LTVPEIKEAFKMSLKNFQSWKFFEFWLCSGADVLNAYKDYRNETLRVYAEAIIISWIISITENDKEYIRNDF